MRFGTDSLRVVCRPALARGIGRKRRFWKLHPRVPIRDGLWTVTPQIGLFSELALSSKSHAADAHSARRTAPWLGPILIVIGWGPLFAFDLVVDVLQRRGIVGPHFGVGYGMGWGTLIAVPATILGVFSILVHLIRAVYRAIARH